MMFIRELEKIYLGKTIEIEWLDDPQNDYYNGKRGVVKKVSLDHWNDVRLDGTWGSIGIYPKMDKIKIIKDDEK